MPLFVVPMKISVFGLGYVGTVTAVCFAKMGHEVIGFDISGIKIAKLEKGEAPIKEEGLNNLLKEGIENKRFTVSRDISFAVENSEISFVCVRTPQNEEGDLDTSEVEKICENIAKPLGNKRGKRHIIVIRSTIPPSTIERLNGLFSRNGLVNGKDFVIASNPEFLREGSAVNDFFDPPYIVIGCDDKSTLEILSSVYKEIKASVYKVSTKTAEAIKLVNNSWHALEMGFINEVSGICKKLNINVEELVNLFCSDTKLNISPYYLKPNMGYGGSCLPKDLGALQKIGKNVDVKCALLNSVSESNIQQIKRAYKIIKEEAKKMNKSDIGILGVAFKPGTDDIRGSPIVYIIEKLKSDGFNVKIYDPIVKKEQIENIRNSYRDTIYDPLLNTLMDIKNLKDALDDIEKMLCPIEETLKCGVVVINAKISQEDLKKLGKNQVLINTRAIISVENKGGIKAKYVEAW